ncbi:MAG: PEP-CTERM sorting domain-containing protein [Planctomycetes bacterium]|nr:PEP-CTERM sorting domain-containing protein [Planctomycetota bacterium]
MSRAIIVALCLAAAPALTAVADAATITLRYQEDLSAQGWGSSTTSYDMEACRYINYGTHIQPYPDGGLKTGQNGGNLERDQLTFSLAEVIAQGLTTANGDATLTLGGSALTPSASAPLNITLPGATPLTDLTWGAPGATVGTLTSPVAFGALGSITIPEETMQDWLDAGEAKMWMMNPVGESNGTYIEALQRTWDNPSYGGVAARPTLIFDADSSAVPEPSTLGLLGAGLLSLALVAWRRKRK